MNILILGSGIVGANLAKKLSEQGKNVFLLDDDANELKNICNSCHVHRTASSKIEMSQELNIT